MKRTAPHPDPQLLYRQAESFSSAYDLLSYQEPAKVRAVLRPAMVVSAFSSELFLKCLLSLEGLPVPHRHELDHLYHSLSEQRKIRLQQIWSDCVEARAKTLHGLQLKVFLDLAPDLQTVLKNGSKVFELARYYYELSDHQKQEFEFVIGDLPIALKIAIWDLAPGWTPEGQLPYATQ